MRNRSQMERMCTVRNQRLFYVVGIITILIILSQILVVPYQNYISVPSHANISLIFSKTILSNVSQQTNADVFNGKANDNSASGWDEDALIVQEEEGSHQGHNISTEVGGQTGDYLEKERQLPTQFTSGRGSTSDKIAKMMYLNEPEDNPILEGLETGLEFTEHVKKLKDDVSESLAPGEIANLTKGSIRSVVNFMSPMALTTGLESVADASDAAVPYPAVNISVVHTDKKDLDLESHKQGDSLLQAGSLSPKDSSGMFGKPFIKKNNRRTKSISDMTILLHLGSPPANLPRPKWFSARDKELQNARRQIENAPVIRNAPRAYAYLFRNYSMFVSRSYELMERVLRVYIYKEGDKPVFHQPHLRGIYASEGWFMKLMEGNRQFVVRDPRKAHLFYLPFSSRRLRSVLYQQNFTSHRDLENHLKNYVHVIASKYRFWNRTKGADHFLVACHDWGPGFTRNSMGSCIRALCNSNIARGFEIGKDVSLPVTYILSAENPLKDLGGNQPSERPTLAFFAGGMHGYLRPILLQYWKDKEPDMKIFGPMPRDPDGKQRYREFMKSSKYCICARGYEVHTPRVIESIYYECIPVIISDNYVPPFFEILDWESFAVFVLEQDIPNLRNVLLSIPEKKYIEMQNRLKMVQRHFLWHKVPVKYDLFYMILHSIWYNRVFQVKS
ncbi:probable glycosyltransferase At3g07620 isoform X1 [Coffea arabica]|uniref:Probable glycosyltransferase At3g07620 isoform X1 n=1 Tax=Coffea arabica TaxID=13443 RepID=A0ABM4UNF0_COFAR